MLVALQLAHINVIDVMLFLRFIKKANTEQITVETSKKKSEIDAGN